MTRLLNRSSTLFLLSLYVISLIYLIEGAFGFTLDEFAPLWLMGICLSTWIAADFKHGLFLGLPLSALLLYAAYRTYDDQLVFQLSDLFDKITGAYYERFYAPGSSYGYSDYAPSHTLILLFIAFLIASYLSTGLTSRNGRILFSLIGTLPPFFYTIAITGTPDPAAIFCMLLFWIMLFVGGDRYDVDSHQGRAMYIAVLPAALVLGLILFLRPPSEYEYTPEDISMSQRFERISDAIRQRFTRFDTVLTVPPDERNPGDSASLSTTHYGFGSSSNGDMELFGGYDFSGVGDIILSARTDAGGYIYLRSRSYGDYAGDSWKEAEEPGGLSSLSYAAYAIQQTGGAGHVMEINLERQAELMLLPYYCTVSQGSDIYVRLEGKESYSAAFVDSGSGSPSLPPEYTQAELDYRSFARDYYTRLPESTKTALLSIAERAGLSADSPNLIQEVAEYVRDAGVYDLSTASYPSDDYAVYFLTEAHMGYCIHFATAAATLYRALGVPARVTEGFLYISRPGDYTEVMGSDAHAWVEVYADGIGWLPVEVTGRSGLVPSPDEPVPPGESLEPSPEESTEPLPADSEVSSTTTPSPTAQPTTTPAGPSVGVISPETPDPPQPVSKTAKIPWGAVGAVMAVLLLLSAIPLRRAILLRAFRQRASQKDRRKAAVAVWKQAVRVSAYGVEIPEEINRCAEKAAFSLHDISREELAACQTLLDHMIQETWGHLNRFKRFNFKYIKCIM